MTKVTIDRELLEQAISTSIHEVPERIKARSEIRAILATPLTYHQRAIAELREECSFLKDCQENAMLHMTGLVSERDTLRQQLADRDATIARLEAGIPRIQEQSHQMRQQRDKLAGLLRDERNWNCVEISCQRGVKDHCLCGTCRILRIDAALAAAGVGDE